MELHYSIHNETENFRTSLEPAAHVKKSTKESAQNGPNSKPATILLGFPSIIIEVKDSRQLTIRMVTQATVCLDEHLPTAYRHRRRTGRRIRRINVVVRT